MPGGGDFHMKWKLKRLWIPEALFNLIGTAGADTGQSNGGPVRAVAAGGSELPVIQMGAAGDEVVVIHPIPWDLRRDRKVLGRIWFIHSSTDADTPDWVVKTKFLAAQATVVDTDTSEDVATAFTAKAVSTTAESLERTNWFDLDWDDYMTSTDVAAQILVECNGLGSAGANEIEFIGLELIYEIEATAEAAGKTAAAKIIQPT